MNVQKSLAIYVLIVGGAFQMPANVDGSEIVVRANSLRLLPGSIVVNVGDTVVWQAEGFGSVEAFDGEFQSPILGGTDAVFGRKFEVAAEIPYRYRPRNSVPPYNLVHTNVEIHGTITVRERPSGIGQVWINAPIKGARFGAGSDEVGNVVGNGGHIDVQASVDDTNGIVRMEFLANGVLVGSAASWPFQITWQPAQIGPLRLKAIAVLDGGGERESEAVDVLVEGFTGAPRALLGNPRLVRPGIYYVEYTLSPAAWYMEVYKDIPFSLRSPEVTVRVNSDWGRVVLSGNETTLFVLPYDRH